MVKNVDFIETVQVNELILLLLSDKSVLLMNSSNFSGPLKQ